MNTKKAGNSKLALNLFIAGKTLKSNTACKNLKFICEEVLKGMYTLKVIDILKHPKQARDNQIFAIPTLILKNSLPKRKIIGDLSNRELILAELNYNGKLK